MRAPSRICFSVFSFTKFAFALFFTFNLIPRAMEYCRSQHLSNLVQPHTNCTFICSLGKIPQAECAYALCAYIALCGAESHPHTKAARLPQTYPRIANSPTSLPLGLLLKSNLLSLTKSPRISPSRQYTATAVCTLSINR